MYKATIFLISFLCINQWATAQFAPTTKWAKCYGGNERDGLGTMIEAHNGGFMVLGSTESKDGNLDTHTSKNSFLAKISNEGVIEWQKFYGNSESGVGDIAKYPEGGYIMCGVSYKVGGDVTQNKGGNDFWVVRINDTGKIIWEKSYGGSNFDWASKVVIDKANNIYIGGSSQSFDGDVKNPNIILPFAGVDYWILKLDPNGNLIWERSYGGTSDDDFYDMALTADNGLFFCGYVESNDGDVVGAHFKPGYGVLDGWMVKIDSSSNIEWQKAVGGTNAEQFSSMVATKDSGCVAVGFATSVDGDLKGYIPITSYYAWVVKFNKDGKIEWQKCLGGTTGYGRAASISLDKDDNYIVTANSNSRDGYLDVGVGFNKKSFLLKFNKQGELIWKRMIGGSRDNFFASILTDAKNSIYISGYTTSRDYDAISTIDTIGVGDGIIIKLNPETYPIKVIGTNNNLSIYPNPASSAVYIATKNIKQIRLIDALGRVYLNEKIDHRIYTGNYLIPLNYVANGTYFLQATTIDGAVKTGKLLIIK
jgi:hypothetical protein